MSSWCPFWRTRFLASPKMRGQAPSCGCTASHFVSSSLYSNTFVGARGCLVSYSLQGRCLSDNGIASHVTEMTRRRRGCRCLSAARRGGRLGGLYPAHTQFSCLFDVVHRISPRLHSKGSVGARDTATVWLSGFVVAARMDPIWRWLSFAHPKMPPPSRACLVP